MSHYVVIQAHWRYNDEIYRRTGPKVGTPKNVFNTYAEAEAVAMGKNLDTLQVTDLAYYFEDIKDIVRDDSLEEFAKLMGLPFENGEVLHGSNVFPKSLTREQLAQLYDCLTITFYDVVEVED